MGSSKQLLVVARQKSVHEILGGGIVADVILWRRRDLTVGILVGALASWMIFQLSGYTLLSLLSSVGALLLSILFAWTKVAELLGRPPPPLPNLHLSKELVDGMVTLLGSFLNKILLAFQDISKGKNSELFYKVAAGLWVTSKIGSLTDLFTAFYIGLALVLTAPVIYERYEHHIGGCAMFGCEKMQQIYRMLCSEIKASAAKFPLGQRKPLKLTELGNLFFWRNHIIGKWGTA